MYMCDTHHCLLNYFLSTIPACLSDYFKVVGSPVMMAWLHCCRAGRNAGQTAVKAFASQHLLPGFEFQIHIRCGSSSMWVLLIVPRAFSGFISIGFSSSVYRNQPFQIIQDWQLQHLLPLLNKVNH